MNPTAIYSKSGKGVQEASGKTTLLKRADRAVLSAIDGRATLAEVARKVGRTFDAAFEALINQLDRDGFVRAVSSGTSPHGSRAAAAPASPGGGADLDFTTIMPIPKAPPKAPADAAQRAREQESALYKARQEAEARAQAERDRLRAEAEAKARAEAEAKFRAEAEKKLREEAEAKARTSATDAKAKAARDAALRVAAEARAKAEAEKARLEAERAKLEAERKAREEAERKAREEAERARREAEELRQRLEEERKAREEAERKAREEEERRRREEEARRAREEAERRAREEEERRAREEEERKRRAEEEERARQAREEEERARRAREEEEERARRAREEEEERARRAQQEEEERARREAEEAQVAPEPEPEPAAVTPKAAATGSLDNLMADLDSFSQREEDERRSRDAAQRKAKDEKARKLREDSERRAQEQAEIERRQAEERRKEEEQRRAQEEAERRVREAEEARAREAEERKKARESRAAAQPAPQPQAAAPADDIGVTDEDLDMDDVRRDEALIAEDSRTAQREREREAREREAREREAHERERAAAAPVKPPKPPRRPVKWGKPLAIGLFVVLLAGIGAVHVMPIQTEPYERAASEALGRPVRISSARLSLFTGVRLNLEGVRIGDTGRIASVRAYPELGSLFGERKAFSRIELEGATLAQQALGEALFAKTKGESFSVGRLIVKDLKVEGGLALPALEADALIGRDGAVRSVTLRGPESLIGNITPGDGKVEFEVTASSFALPVAPDISLNSFVMKGTATRQGMNIASWGGAILDGALSGVASVRWTGGWQIDGVLTVRNINAAVFAPALLSEGRAEGTGKFSMSAADPAKLANASRVEGKFTVHKGVLGSFDLSRLIQTSGRQAGGRTQFAEMTGQGVYDRGAVALRDVQISAGALNAGASADIAQNGALSGRIVADVKTATQTLRQTLVLGGTVKEPQVRN